MKNTQLTRKNPAFLAGNVNELSLRLVIAGLLASVHAAPALAVGLDRSGQPIGIIFEAQDQVSFSASHVSPSVSGQGIAPFTGPTGKILNSYSQFGLAVKKNLTDSLSAAFIIDMPYGVDLSYSGNGNAALYGTSAKVDSRAYTGVLRYKFNENFSVHGGPRYQTLTADVRLKGMVYGRSFGPNGYEADFAEKGASGYVVGAAYEMPAIALRVALTYNSAITHHVDTEERVGGGVFKSVTEIKAPEAVNLNLQTGIAPKTLLMGSARYAKYEQLTVKPKMLNGGSLTNFENGTEYSIGVGRQLSDKLSGFVSVGYQPRDSAATKSPLSPTNGSKSLTVGGSYDVTDRLTMGAGLTYAKPGDARIAQSGTNIVDVNGSSAVAGGVRITYKY
ncbi:MAG: hypothetical protein C4K60_19740 [Ideonella sp. MAG2]|nr:MAG: hypothetical protein C4K60_19740 [Ideonella sp. MAG2]